jgi:outer membrane protein assembly factor BamB
MPSRVRFSCIALLAWTAVASAADWPQWRGPNRDGHSADKNLLKEWPKEGPKLLWAIEDGEADRIGTGYGSPAVVGDKIFLLGGTTAKQDSKDFVVCLEVKDGKQVWKSNFATSKGGYSDGWGGGPRSTPTVSGDFVYVLGATGDLVCLSKDKGETKWAKNLVKDFGGSIPGWGYSESVLVDGNNVVCTAGGKAGMIALDKLRGEKVWTTPDLKDDAGYSSMVIAEIGGVKQYIQQTDRSAIGVRAKDGKILWKEGTIKRSTAVIPSPVLFENYAFFTSGYGAGCEGYKLEADGEGMKATKLFDNTNMVNQIGGAVGLGGFVYGHSDSGGQWVCLKIKTGDLVWKNQGVGKGSLAFADGYFTMLSEGGTVGRFKATEKAYEAAGTFKLPTKSKLRPGSGQVWAHPVIADGKLFLRDYEMLFVYDLRTAK